MKPEKGDEALRRFRVSRPYSDYFLTMNTIAGKDGLIAPIVAPALRHEIHEIEQAGYWTIRRRHDHAGSSPLTRYLA